MAEPAIATDPADMIQTDVANDHQLSGSEIHVRIEEGVAILTGQTTSLANSDRVAARALASESVRAVVNQIAIAPVDDRRVLDAAKTALRNQRMLVAKGIKLSVDHHRAKLTGTVGTPDEAQLARDVVAGVAGLQAVDNQLQVTFEGIRTDAQIAEQLRYMIQCDPLYAGLEFSVQVKDGTAKLGGRVGTKGEFDRLVRRSYVTGIVDVQIGGLNIDPALAMEGLEDKEYSVEESMRAMYLAVAHDSRLEDAEIVPSLDGGVMTLQGTVTGSDAREAAESCARLLPGVTQVSNELHIGRTQAASEAMAVAPPLNQQP